MCPERRLGIYFHGVNGTLYANYGMHEIVAEGDAMKDVPPPPVSLPPSPGHEREWLNCIRTREQPSCCVDYHYRIDLAINLANLSMRLGRDVRWDPADRRVRERRGSRPAVAARLPGSVAVPDGVAGTQAQTAGHRRGSPPSPESVGLSRVRERRWSGWWPYRSAGGTPIVLRAELGERAPLFFGKILLFHDLGIVLCPRFAHWSRHGSCAWWCRRARGPQNRRCRCCGEGFAPGSSTVASRGRRNRAFCGHQS